jgi:hypothetical protein
MHLSITLYEESSQYLEEEEELIFKPLKKDNTIHLLVMVTILDLARNTKSQPSILTSRTCMQNNQTFAFTRGYFWGIRPIIRKPHIICAVILVNPCFIHVHDIIPCFPKRFDLSQIITPIINNKHLIVQNSSIITYFL